MEKSRSDYPLVSVIVLCRNEEKFIGKCLESIISNDYPKEKLEVLVVDGMSEDGTRKIVEEYQKRESFIRLINNPKKLTPFAFNEGIKNSHGELVMIMSSHAQYEKNYIKKCVNASQKYNADNVVGVWKILPRNNTHISKAIVSALSSSFGVGNAKYRTGTSEKPEWVDTGAYGCYKRDVFKRVGLFNEELIHTQDMEFNLRLKRAGGKTLLLPDAKVFYYARTDFKSFSKYNFRNGVWAILPFKYTEIVPVSWRHLIPLTFVLSLGGSLVLSAFSSIFFWLFCLIVGTYFLVSIYYAAKIAKRRKDFKSLFIMPLIFTSLHLSYGLGSLSGLFKVLISKKFWKNRFKR